MSWVGRKINKYIKYIIIIKLHFHIHIYTQKKIFKLF